MRTQVLRIEEDGSAAEAIRRAAKLLNDGHLVAFPTETVYGVGARADIAAAVGRLRELKDRSAEQAFTVHLGNREGVERFVPRMSKLSRRLIRKVWPGPLTLILPVSDAEAAPVLIGLGDSARDAMYYGGTIGLRCPDDPVAAALLRAVTAPVVAASANLAGQPPPQTADEVCRGLDGRVDLVIDNGRTRYNKPSTIVKIAGDSYELVREGVYDARTVARLATLRILFVCSGNTCRSPMAAGLGAKVAAELLGCPVMELAARGVAISSAGTAGGHGPAADHAIEVMRRRDVDISDHVSTALNRERVHQADYTFCMTSEHRNASIDLDPSAEDRVRLLLDDEEITDPIGGTEEDYELCARKIEGGVRARMKEILS